MNYDFFLSDSFIWSYCLIIVAIWLCCAVRLLLKTRDLHTKIRDVNEKLNEIDGKDGFAAAFEMYDKSVKREFGLPWTEFVETLVLPAPGSGDPIRNTDDVSRYLNDTTIIFPRISFGFYQSVPNLLTGVGILGTFVGLASGVGVASSGLASGNPDNITASLQQLLEGASLAFLTSIFGIFFSILFVLVDRITSRRLHLDVSRWVGAIEARLEHVTPESIALKQLDLAQRMTKQLESFNTDLVFALEQALEEKVAGRLSPQLERLIEAVEGVRLDRSTDAGQMIEQALARFTSAMQERTGTQFDEMAAIVTNLNRTLTDSAAALSKSQEDVRATLSSVMIAVKDSMDHGANAMTRTLQRSLKDVVSTLGSATRQLADQMTESSTGAANEIRTTFSSATEDLAKAGVEAASQITGSLQGLQAAAGSLDRSTRQSEQVLEGMTTFVDRINSLRETMELAYRQIGDVAEPIGRAAQDIRASSEKTAGTLSQMNGFVTQITQHVRTMEEYQKSLVRTWEGYQDRFQGIDQALGKVFQQIDEGLSRYCKQIESFMRDLDRLTAKNIGDLAGASGEISQAIVDLGEIVGNLRRAK